MPVSESAAAGLDISADYTVTGDAQFDYITAPDDKTTISLKSPNSLTINSQNNQESYIAAALYGFGTLTLYDASLTVKDNAKTKFNGTINLEGKTIVNVDHLTAFTGDQPGTINVGEGAVLKGKGNGIATPINVKAKLSGNGTIDLTEAKGSIVALSNSANAFKGTFKLTNGTLKWDSGAANFFADTTTELSNANIDVESSVTFKSLALSGTSWITFANNSTLALGENHQLNLSADTLIRLVGTGTMNALLTGEGMLAIGGSSTSIGTVTLSDSGAHSFDGRISVLNGSTLTVNGSISGTGGDLAVYGTLNMNGAFDKSEGNINVLENGKATFEGELSVGGISVNGTLDLKGNAQTKGLNGLGPINIESGKALTINFQGTKERDLQISNVFNAANSTININRQNAAGKVTFYLDSGKSTVGTLRLTNSLLSSSNAGTFLQNAGQTFVNTGSILTIDKDLGVNTLTLDGGELSFEGRKLSADKVVLNSGQLYIAAKDLDANAFNVFKNSTQEQVVIVTTSGITGLENENVSVELSGLASSILIQNGTTEVAQLHWKDPQQVNSAQTLSATYKLDSITLLDNAEGSGGYTIEADSNQTLSTPLNGDGNVTFASSSAAKSDIRLIIDADNSYTGATYVKSAGAWGIIVAPLRNATFGETKLLSIGTKGTVDIQLGINTVVGALEVAEGGTLSLNGELTVKGGSNNYITGEITGTTYGILNINSSLSVSGQQSYAGTINLEENAGLELVSVKGQSGANVFLQATIRAGNKSTITTDFTYEGGPQTLTLNVTPKDKSSTWNLVIADNTYLKLGKTFEGLDSIRFAKTGNETPKLTLDDQYLGTAAVNTIGGEFFIHFESSKDKKFNEIQNVVSGDGIVYLLGDKDEVAFTNKGTSEFNGIIDAYDVILKSSGTKNQLWNASLRLRNGAMYVADESGVTLGALTVLDGSTLQFTSTALPGPGTSTANSLYVQNGITIESGGIVDVAEDVIRGLNQDVGQGNLLEQDDNSEHAIMLANTNTGKTIKVAEGAVLKVKGETLEGKQKKFQIGEDAWGTYDYRLVASGQNLSVTYGLKTLEVNKDRMVTLGQNKSGGEAALDARVTGEGGLTINTTEAVTLENANNDYTGATHVVRGNIIVNEGALGKTASLDVDSRSVVTIQGDQTDVQALNVLGRLHIQKGALTVNGSDNTVVELTTDAKDALKGSGSLTLKGSNSRIEGANSGFSGAVTLADSSTTEINDVDGLGSGLIVLEEKSTLKANLSQVDFDNKLMGNGLFKITSDSPGTPDPKYVAFSNATAFSGTFDLPAGSTIAFSTQSKDDFILSSKIIGATSLVISGNGGKFAFNSADSDQIAGITDRLQLSNVKFTLDKKVEGKNLWAKDTELQVASKSSLGDLSLNDSKLIFAEEGAPGTIGPAGTHLSVQNLSFSGTNTIQLDNMFVAANPPEDSSKVGLTAQDVLSEDQNVRLKTVLITSTNPIKGAKAAGFTLVDKNGVSIESEKFRTFAISDKDGNHVADGTYSYGISTDDAENNIGIAWLLTSVSILEKKTLSLSERKGEDNVLSAKLIGEGGFTVESGSITLANENEYEGPTTVNSNSEIVATNDKSLGKTSRLDNRGTVTMTDRQIEVFGPTDNSGTINIGMGTYTTGSYKGSENSVLRIAAEVTADKASSGMLVVNGLAEGTSRVDLQLTDATIGRAVTGIDVAKLGEGSTLTLSLANPVSKGDYNYLLMSTDDGTSYYIVGTLKDAGGGDQQGGDGGEEEGGDDDKKPMTTSQLKTPEAGARAALAFLNLRAFDFGLNAHIGEKSYADPFTGEKKTTSLWLIQGGSWSKMNDSSGQLRNDGHMTTTNLGGDLYAWNAAGGRFSVGLMGGWVDGSYDVDSSVTGLKADADFDGWSLGAYAARQHEGESGLFANAQVRWNDFTNEVKGQGLAKEKYHARGLSLGVEAGWNQRLWTAAASDASRAMAWDAAPFARVTWSGVSADDQTDAYGQRFSVEGDGNVAITLGARTSFEFGSKDQTPRFADPIVRVYAEGAWVHNTKTFESTVVNDKGASTAEFGIDDYGQFRVGVEGEFTKNFHLWGDVTHEAGGSGYSSTGFTVGAKYVF
ncbi:autotransporter outer membrane beta-barrel domain-containing protein [uncultured Sutterella sp.]|uniref:autotransporter outer membrane beta-barrel domain-containing protein n=1 Tax=uncultured Sutterella sp. TaxID=286133 RepID=UPI00280B52A8|nr:autotransporter outer membrane beta-barrel domain-containing protein [uncultured Sutterella sp.]